MRVICCLDPYLAEKSILEELAHFSHLGLMTPMLGASDTSVSVDLSLIYSPIIINHLLSTAETWPH